MISLTTVSAFLADGRMYELIQKLLIGGIKSLFICSSPVPCEDEEPIRWAQDQFHFLWQEKYEIQSVRWIR